MSNITINTTSTSKSSTSAVQTAGRFTSTSEAFWAAASDEHTTISFDRCTDWLLDLYQTTQDVQLRGLITEVLDDLRALGPVEGEFEDIVLGALASVEVAFEIKMAA